MDNYTHIFLTQEEAIEDERLVLQAAATAMIIYLGAEESQVLHGNNPISVAFNSCLILEIPMVAPGKSFITITVIEGPFCLLVLSACCFPLSLPWEPAIFSTGDGDQESQGRGMRAGSMVGGCDEDPVRGACTHTANV